MEREKQSENDRKKTTKQVKKNEYARKKAWKNRIVVHVKEFFFTKCLF